jgi:hypothetical protein
MMPTSLFRLVFVGALAFVTGCGRPFDVKTAPGFVPLENQASYDYRATTPEGIVVGVRAEDDGRRGDLAFWTDAITLRMRDEAGYALVSASDVTSLDGTPGRQLRFGHDEDGKPFAYWVTLFVAQDRLFVVEAGGAKDAFEHARPNVEWMMKSVRVRCRSILSPVLASRTCNRW